MEKKEALVDLSAQLTGKLYFDDLWKSIYATDASVYREIPLAVCIPENEQDLLLLIKFAEKHQTSLIPRTAGTSLAGQCTGDGIVVDVSKYFTDIINIDVKNETVTLQPGVIRDDLNRKLEKHGLFFGPNTSTSNRCMIGGMVGNNSSGTTSIKYGTTRDKLVSLKVILSDGSRAEFKDLSQKEFAEKLKLDNLEGHIYRSINDQLSEQRNQEEILKNYPPPELHRRNTGYAIDELLNSENYTPGASNFNFSKLMAGSEGTLAFITEITLKLDQLPPKHTAMVAAHYKL